MQFNIFCNVGLWLTRGVVGLNAAKIVFCNLVPALLEGRGNVSLQLHVPGVVESKSPRLRCGWEA